jgi:hypothetical protein
LTSGLPKKIISPERVLPPVYSGDKYEALSSQLETVCLNGVCTINVIETLLNTVHKLSEDVTVLKSDNASIKSPLINYMKKLVNLRDLVMHSRFTGRQGNH